MWLRTTINFQMAKGMSTFEAMRFLYAEGGIPRFYQGMWAALLQAPLSRFGDTAANAGVLSLLEGSATVPVFVKTLLASVAAGSWRVLIMPIDAVKTTLQVQGAAGMKQLAASIQSNGIGSLYAGALGANLATFMGHYPWFYVNNLLEVTSGQMHRVRLLISLSSSLSITRDSHTDSRTLLCVSTCPGVVGCRRGGGGWLCDGA
jgi:hypothetical protein